MALYRIPISRDNTISTYNVLGNTGAAPIDDIWCEYNIDKNQKYLARILAYACLTALTNGISNGTIPDPTTSSTTCLLKFFNINTADQQAYDFNIQCFPVTRSWIEGIGNRIDTFSNSGISNWVSASTTACWTSSGGDYSIDSNSSSQYFETGYENLCLNIKGILTSWTNSLSSNYGFILKMDNNAESLTAATSTNTQYFRKSFHGRTSNFYNFTPYIELQWNDVVKDDRAIVQFGYNSNLYFYNNINDNFQDIDNNTNYFPGYVTLSGSTACSDSSMSSYQAILTINTPLRIKTGTYQSNFVLPLSSSIYTTFVDIWSITSASSAIASSIINSFQTIKRTTPTSNYPVKLDITIIDGLDYLIQGNVVTKRLFIKEKLNNDFLIQSEFNSISSAAISSVSNYISTNGFFKVVIDDINVDDTNWMPLNYDIDGNYFILDTSNFHRNTRYYLEFLINYKGQNIIIKDESFKFEIL